MESASSPTSPTSQASPDVVTAEADLTEVPARELEPALGSKTLTFKWKCDPGSLALLKRLAIASGHPTIRELFSTFVTVGIQSLLHEIEQEKRRMVSEMSQREAETAAGPQKTASGIVLPPQNKVILP